MPASKLCRHIDNASQYQPGRPAPFRGHSYLTMALNIVFDDVDTRHIYCTTLLNPPHPEAECLDGNALPDADGQVLTSRILRVMCSSHM